MNKKTMLLAVVAIFAVTGPVSAQPYGQNYRQPNNLGYGPNRNFDPDGYYSQSDPYGMRQPALYSVPSLAGS